MAVIGVEATLPDGTTRCQTGYLDLACSPQTVECAFAELEATLTAILNGQELIALLNLIDNN